MKGSSEATRSITASRAAIESGRPIWTTRSMRFYFIMLGALSVAINALTLASPVFVLLIYDWVMPSRRVELLMALFGAVVGLLGLRGLLRFVQVRILRALAQAVDEKYSSVVFRSVSDKEALDGGSALKKDLDRI